MVTDSSLLLWYLKWTPRRATGNKVQIFFTCTCTLWAQILPMPHIVSRKGSHLSEWFWYVTGCRRLPFAHLYNIYRENAYKKSYMYIIVHACSECNMFQYYGMDCMYYKLILVNQHYTCTNYSEQSNSYSWDLIHNKILCLLLKLICSYYSMVNTTCTSWLSNEPNLLMMIQNSSLWC